MKIFAWKSEEKYFIDDDGQVLLTEKPVFSFEYDTLFYSNTLSRKNETIPLSDSEKTEIDNFITQYKLTNIKAFCADDNGNYLGYVDYVEGVNNKVPYPPPDNTFIWSFGKNIWQKKYFYNSTGHQTTEENAVGFTTKVPPSDGHIFSVETDSWVLNDVATYDRKFITKIKTVGSLMYYMDFVYGNQNHIKEIISFIKENATTNNKTDLIEVCNSFVTIVDNCDTAKDKKELEKQFNEVLMLINQKVMTDNSEPVFLQTDTWKSIDKL